MKSFFLAAISLFIVNTAVKAQHQAVSGKAVISTPTIQCEKCRDRVTFFLGREDGISSVKVDIKRKTTTVTWLNDRTTLENIKVFIANLGFDADDIEREESAYKRLPAECKLHSRPEKPKEPDTKQ